MNFSKLSIESAVSIVNAKYDAIIGKLTSYNDLFGISCQCGYLEIVKILLQDARVNPAYDSNIAISFACDNGHTEVVEALLQDYRVDPTTTCDYILDYPLKKGYMKIVKLLVNRGILEKCKPEEQEKYERAIKKREKIIKRVNVIKCEREKSKNVIKRVEFSIGFYLCHAFTGFSKLTQDDKFYEPYEFEEGDKFCWLPGDMEGEITDIYIKCIPNKTSFYKLMLETIYKVNIEHPWIAERMRKMGGHTNFEGIFTKKGNIWSYSCAS